MADLLHVLKDPGHNLISIVFAQNRGLFAFKKVIDLQNWMFRQYVKRDIFVCFFLIGISSL